MKARIQIMPIMVIVAFRPGLLFNGYTIATYRSILMTIIVKTEAQMGVIAITLLKEQYHVGNIQL
jgi:hypothetical protein